MQGCPFLPTLFGIYLDELEAHFGEHTHADDGCLLHHVLISLILFTNDVVLLASSLEGLQIQLDAFTRFCDLMELVSNLNKMNVRTLNVVKQLCQTFTCTK
jgi:hypothetical protein